MFVLVYAALHCAVVCVGVVAEVFVACCLCVCVCVCFYIRPSACALYLYIYIYIYICVFLLSALLLCVLEDERHLFSFLLLSTSRFIAPLLPEDSYYSLFIIIFSWGSFFVVVVVAASDDTLAGFMIKLLLVSLSLSLFFFSFKVQC